MATSPRMVRGKFNVFERELAAQRDALLARFSRDRFEMEMDREPDDEVAEANRNMTRHLVLSMLDREQRTLGEIEIALGRLRAGDYGICERCGHDIPMARLNALPWTRVCIGCADDSERRSKWQ
jgi:DnaK suppressor protein